MTNEEFIQSIALPDEEWKEVPGLEGYCLASSLGRIVSCGRYVNSSYGSIKWKEPKLQVANCDKNGYCSVSISIQGKQKRVLVHRLIAKAFIPNPENKSDIDHIDANRSNNLKSNLRWCTKSENNRNPITASRNSSAKRGKQHPHNFSPVVGIKDGIVVHSYKSAKFAITDGYSVDAIYQACKGKRKTYKGMIWMYLSDYESLVQYIKELYPDSGLIRRR